VGLRPVEDPVQSRFDLDAGAYVAYVDQGEAAAEAGLPRDVIITALDDTPIETPEDVKDYLQQAEAPILVQVQRTDGTQAFYEID
jgi:S1-C subfamily serine protease